jgi:large subunit ribosomal protein L30
VPHCAVNLKKSCKRSSQSWPKPKPKSSCSTSVRRSPPVKHKLVVKGLGFTRLNQIVEREDTPSIRGMVAKIPHLVRIVE